MFAAIEAVVVAGDMTELLKAYALFSERKGLRAKKVLLAVTQHQLLWRVFKP